MTVKDTLVKLNKLRVEQSRHELARLLAIEGDLIVRRAKLEAATRAHQTLVTDRLEEPLLFASFSQWSASERRRLAQALKSVEDDLIGAQNHAEAASLDLKMFENPVGTAEGRPPGADRHSSIDRPDPLMDPPFRRRGT
ncbi:MAG: hypothetical protein E2O89_06380 [Alphaproteobacteria bacterium]|nr:MAG: hypothetical protein E2O89_06380 [Alphaproteobacteria bacterium]